VSLAHSLLKKAQTAVVTGTRVIVFGLLSRVLLAAPAAIEQLTIAIAIETPWQPLAAEELSSPTLEPVAGQLNG
jgi:hypothetical protein